MKPLSKAPRHSTSRPPVWSGLFRTRRVAVASFFAAMNNREAASVDFRSLSWPQLRRFGRTRLPAPSGSARVDETKPPVCPYLRSTVTRPQRKDSATGISIADADGCASRKPQIVLRN